LLFDCIVVGGGPSGASAAYNLAKKNRSVLLIDKATLPRYKPCGGGVSPEVTRWVDLDFSPVISYKVSKIACTWDMEPGATSELSEDVQLWMVRREHFDNFIVQNAKKLGAEIKENTKVLSVERVDGRWIVKTDAGDFESHYLIAADGSKGIVAKQLGFTDRKRAIAGAMEIEIPQDKVEDATLLLEFGIIKKGYAWNFPKADGYSVGIGCVDSEDGKRMHQLLDRYLAGMGLSGEGHKKFGHPINLWDGNQTLHTEAALLVGDAACLVDPFTAEGIRPAIMSGAYAADAIDAALNGDKNALKLYTKRIQHEHGTEMTWARRLSKATYAFPRAFFQTFLKGTTAGQTFGHVFSGKSKYSELAPRALKKLVFRS
jgi:geranylgeranyl reductase family protein